MYLLDNKGLCFIDFCYSLISLRLYDATKLNLVEKVLLTVKEYGKQSVCFRPGGVSKFDVSGRRIYPGIFTSVPGVPTGVGREVGGGGHPKNSETEVCSPVYGSGSEEPDREI